MLRIKSNLSSQVYNSQNFVVTKSVIYTKVIVRTIAQAKRRLPFSSTDFRLKNSGDRDVCLYVVNYLKNNCQDTPKRSSTQVNFVAKS